MEKIKARNFKIPPAGTRVRLGDVLNARHTYEIHTGGDWSVEVYANNAAEAKATAERNGYTSFSSVQID